MIKVTYIRDRNISVRSISAAVGDCGVAVKTGKSITSNGSHGIE